MQAHRDHARPLLSGTCLFTNIMSKRARSDIIGCDEEQVVKLYSQTTPRDVVEEEVLFTGVARAHGLRVPEVVGVVEDDGRWGYTYKLIQGPTMLQEAALGDEASVDAIAEAFAYLHWQIHCHYDSRLPSVKSRLRSTIEAGGPVRSRYKDEALGALGELLGGTSICHGDFHPENVIMASEGPTVIDWVDAAAGHPLADVARTWVLLQAWLPMKAAEQGYGLPADRHARLCRGYLKGYFGISGASEEPFRQWLLPVAVARLCQGVPGEEQQLTEIIDELG